MTDQSQQTEPPEPNEAFAEDLRAMCSDRPFVPERIDQAVLGQAGPHLRGLRRHHPRRIAAVFGGIAAAGFTFGLLMPPIWTPGGEAADPLGEYSVSQPVDVVDALRLARALDRDGLRISPTWDLSGDGVVDRTDVDVLAMRAVALRDETEERHG